MGQRDGSATINRLWFETLISLGYTVTILGFNFGHDRWPAGDVDALRAAGGNVVIIDLFAGRFDAVVRQLSTMAYALFTGNRFAPEWIGCTSEARKALDATLAPAFNLIVINGVNSLYLAGADRLHVQPGLRLLDIHDLVPRRVVLLQRTYLHMIVRRLRGRAGLLKRSELPHAVAWPSERHLMRFELPMMRIVDRVCCASGEELAALRSWGMGDDQLRRIRWPIDQVAPGTAASPTTPRFAFGLLASDAMFNVEGLLFFLEKVFPLIRATLPDAGLCVAGSICRAMSARRPPVAGVTLLGWVNDVADFYARTSVILVPLSSGTGVSIKALEAAAYGAAIVATPVGVRGLDLQDGKDVRVAATPEDFAAACIALIRDPARAIALGRAARQAMTTHNTRDGFRARVAELIAEPRVNAGTEPNAVAENTDCTTL